MIRNTWGAGVPVYGEAEGAGGACDSERACNGGCERPLQPTNIENDNKPGRMRKILFIFTVFTSRCEIV